MIQSLIDPPKTIQDRLRNMEFVHAGESPLYGKAADEIDSLLLKLHELETAMATIPKSIEEAIRIKADRDSALLKLDELRSHLARFEKGAMNQRIEELQKERERLLWEAGQHLTACTELRHRLDSIRKLVTEPAPHVAGWEVLAEIEKIVVENQ